MKLSLRSISLALLVLLAGGIITWAAAPDTPIIRIAVGENKVVRFPGGITRVAIGTPGLVSVTITGREEMLLNGTAPGNTTLHIWNDEQQVRQYALHVMTRDQLFISDAEKIQGAYDIGVAAQSDGRILIKGFIRDNSVRTKLLNLAQVYYSEIIDGLLLPGEDAPLTTAMTEGNLTQSDTTVVTKLFSPRSRTANDLKNVVSGMLSASGNIIIDIGTNSLIVIDTPENVETIGRFIKRLDEQTTAQVMIEAKFIELTDDGAHELGMTWGGVDENENPTAGITAIGSNHGPVPTNPIAYNADGSVRDASDNGTSLAGRFINGATTIALNSMTGNLKDLTINNLSATLQALETANKLNLLSAPSVTTMNGQEANVSIEDQQTYISGYNYIYGDGGERIGGTPILSIQKTGIYLTVTPTIGEDDIITLNITPKVSDISGRERVSDPDGSYPVDLLLVNERVTSNTVQIRDGGTLIIAGLIRDRKLQGSSSVPFLSSIPLIGKFFFGTETESSRKSNITIFITAHIIRFEQLPASDMPASADGGR